MSDNDSETPTDEPNKHEGRLRDPSFYEASERNRWQKGMPSPNPKGRPRGKSRATILKHYLDVTFKDKDGNTKPQPFGLDGEPLTVEQVLALQQILKASKGDTKAFIEIMDSVYGKNPDIVIPLEDVEGEMAGEIKDLKGEALKQELLKRGLPTEILEE